jgi:hypothetical protein
VLYNTFKEVGRAVEILEEALEGEVRYSKGEEKSGDKEVSVDMTVKG